VCFALLHGPQHGTRLSLTYPRLLSTLSTPLNIGARLALDHVEVGGPPQYQQSNITRSWKVSNDTPKCIFRFFAWTR
jgi:hypothetical protein